MRFTAKQKQEIVQVYLSGISTNKIGKELGCHKSYVSAVLREYAVPYGPRRLTGAEEVEMIRLYRDHASGTEIARRFETTPTSVYGALMRHGVARRPPNNGFVGGCDHEFFRGIDTEAKAYFLGAMGGDGCVSRGNEIIFSLKASDCALVEAFREALKIEKAVRFDERFKVFGRYRFAFRRAVVSVGSPRLAADLARYSVIPAKTGRTIPALVPQQVPTALERHYWRGWVDTDGWLLCDMTKAESKPGRRRQLGLGLTGDPPVVEAFRQFCAKYVPSTAGIHANGNIKRFLVTDSFAMRIASVLYDDATIFLERKRDRYLSWRVARPDWL
jgi:transposase-like protein